MKLLTKNTDYAIRALMALGQAPGKFVSARKISQDQGIPYSYLRKILQDLIKNGLVESREGGHGGVRLKVPPRTIRLVNIIRTFQGRIQLSECMFRKKICPNRKVCALRREILDIEESVTLKFARLTVGQLMRKMQTT